MKEALKRIMGFAQTPPPQAETVAPATTPKEEVNMTVEVTGGASAEQVDVASLQATVASLTEQLAASQAKVAELSEFAEAAKEFKANAEKVAAEAKQATRTAKLVDAIGTEAAAGLQAAVAAMDDAAFDTLVTAMSFKAAKEATAPAFKESGVDAPASAEQVATQAQSTRVMDYLKNMTHDSQAQ